MTGYGFGYDPELPAGFQDADLEMREWEDRARYDRDESDFDCTGNFDGFTVGSDADPGL